MSDAPTSVNPDSEDMPLAHIVTSIQNVLPNHTLEMTSSLVKRGPLKNVDRLSRTHYIKLDCKIKDMPGNTVQEFNRFILLDLSLTP